MCRSRSPTVTVISKPGFRDKHKKSVLSTVVKSSVNLAVTMQRFYFRGKSVMYSSAVSLYLKCSRYLKKVAIV